MKLFSDHKFNKTDSPDAKLIISCLDEMNFCTQARVKSTRDTNLNKNYFRTRALIASALQQGIFLAEDANEICDRLCLIIQE